MTQITVRYCFGSELLAAPNRDELLDEYASEAAIDGMPSPQVHDELYKVLEASGALKLIGAFVDDVMIGFIVVLNHVLPHYGVRMAVSESFFVAKAHRKGGAGLMLLREAERHAIEVGAPGLLVSAPTGGRLAALLPNIGYRETNRVFFKRLSDE